ncbi:MAG: hypothetical protein AAF612_02380 [Planctomycetota bacterium]
MSEQSIRNWAASGVIPEPQYTAVRHRRFTDEHVEGVRAYLRGKGSCVVVTGLPTPAR